MGRISCWNIASVKYCCLTDGCCLTCKNAQNPSYPQNSCHNTILLWYVSMWGVYLHYTSSGLLPQGGDVFNLHANFKIVPNFHTISQITPKLLRYSLRRNPRNSSKNKFSDNSKSPILALPSHKTHENQAFTELVTKSSL